MFRSKQNLYSGLIAMFSVLLVCCQLPTMTANRYFQFDFALEINNQPYTISYNWHCSESLNLSEGDGSYHSNWNISPVRYDVLKKLGNAALIFKPPLYCGNETDQLGINGKPYMSDIMYISSITDHPLVEMFSEQRTQGNGSTLVIKSRSIRQLDRPTPDYVMSEEESHLIHTLKPVLQNYQSVVAEVIPTSIWKKSESLKQYFKDAKGIVIAPTPTQFNSSIAGLDGRHNFFPVNQREIYPLTTGGFYTIPFKKAGNSWLPASNESTSAITYFPADIKSTGSLKININEPPQAIVNYDGKSINVINSQQIFDSNKQLLIQFKNRYLPLISVSN